MGVAADLGGRVEVGLGELRRTLLHVLEHQLHLDDGEDRVDEGERNREVSTSAWETPAKPPSLVLDRPYATRADAPSR